MLKAYNIDKSRITAMIIPQHDDLSQNSFSEGVSKAINIKSGVSFNQCEILKGQMVNVKLGGKPYKSKPHKMNRYEFEQV